jgi:transcriptional regulator with XRE-family HTH domain
MTDVSSRVGGNVRAEMARVGYTQTAMAEQLGITQQGLSQRLQGRIPFRIDELDRIALVLGVELTTLIA